MYIRDILCTSSVYELSHITKWINQLLQKYEWCCVVKIGVGWIIKTLW